MLVSNIIVIVSLILDGILTNFLPYMVSDLSIFTPLLTVVSLVVIYPFFKKDKKKYLTYSFIVGIIYDLLYTNLLFFNGLIFLVVGLLIIILYQNIGNNYLKIILNIVLVIISYELLTVLVIFCFNLVPLTLDKVIYKISHSLLLNIIYGEVIYLILKKIPKKYLKVRLD